VSGADRAARELRRRIAAAPAGEVESSRDELVAALAGDDGRARDSIDASPQRMAQALLVHHGIDARPPIDEPAAGGDVRLGLTQRYATQGAVATTLVVAAAAFLSRPVYGLVLAAAGGAGVALAASAPPRLGRVLPSWLPRGRLAGVALSGAFVLLAAVAVVLPLRASYRDDASSTATRALIDQAAAALKAGDLDQAWMRLGQARPSDADVGALEALRRELVVAQANVAVEDALAKQSVYARALALRAEGRTREALRLLTDLRGFRDVDARIARYRRELAGG
jgi:hypothetical protein